MMENELVAEKPNSALGGATMVDVVLLKKTVGSKRQVKASGGFQRSKVALRMMEVGASRISVSSGTAILSEAP